MTSPVQHPASNSDARKRGQRKPTLFDVIYAAGWSINPAEAADIEHAVRAHVAAGGAL